MSSGRQPQWSLGCDAALLGNSVLAASDAKWQPGIAASLLDKARGGSSPLDVLLQAVEPDLTLLRQANDDESGDIAEQRYGTLTAEQQTQMRPKPREPGLASPHAYVLAQEKHGGDDGQFNKTASAEHRHKGGAQPEQSLHPGDDERRNRNQVAPRPGEQRPQTHWGEQQHLRQQRFVAPPHGGARYRVRGGVVQYVYPTQYSRAGPPAPPSQHPPHVPLPAQGTRHAGPLPSSQEGPRESSGPYAVPCYVPAEAKGGQVYAQYRGQSVRGRPTRDRDSRPKKPGKYVCPYCGRACAKPSVLKKHIRSHTGERPYPCLACGFAFKTKSNLYKHRKSHAHAVKAGLVCGTDDGGGSGDWTEIEKSFSLERSASAEKSLAMEEQFGVGKLEIDQEAHSELDESTDTDDETAVEDASLDIKECSAGLLSESCFDYGQQRVQTSPCQTELSADTKEKHDGDRPQDIPQHRSGEENVERISGSAKGSQGTGDMQSFLPRVVLVPPNPSAPPSTQFTDSFRKPLTSDVKVCMEESEKQRSPKPKLNWSAKVTEEGNLRSASSENLLRPNTFGSKSSTDSGYFSRSESADQPLTSPTNFHPLSYKDIVLGRNFPIQSRGRAMPNCVPAHIEEVSLKKERLVSSWTPSEHSISLNTERTPSNTQPTAQQANIDRSHVACSIDSSGATDTYRDGDGTGTDERMSKMAIAAAIYKPGPVKLEAGGEYLLVPSLETPGFPRSNSMPSYTQPDDTEVKTPIPLRGSHSFDEPASTFHGDACSSSNLYFANHRSLVRQTAVQADEFPVASESKIPTASQSSRVPMVGTSQNPQDTGEGLNVGRRASPTTGEQHMRARRPARYSRGSFYECHTCKVTYKKVENYIVHKRLYCSELHMFPSSSNSSLEMESPAGDAAHEGETGAGKASDRSVLIRKRRKQRSVGDEEDMLTECVSAGIAQPMLSGFIEEPYLDDHDTVFEKHDVPEGPRDVSVTAPMTMNSQAPKWQHSDPVKPQPPQLLVDGGSRRGLSLESGLSCYSSIGGYNEISVIQHTKSLSQPSSFERADSLETARSLSPDGCKGAQRSQQQQQQFSLPALQATEHNKEDHASLADSLSIRGIKLVRQNNIQVPEILVTEEPDLVQPTDAPEKESEKKMEEDFSWPKRSETLSQLPPEKLPPKKKRLRLAELGNSSFESSTDSSFSGSLSRSPSLESNLSRCSSLSISLDRVELDDEKPKAEPEEKPRQEEVAFLTVPTSHHHRQHHHSREMRRSASEQARSPQYAGPGMAEIRSKSFDCGSISNSPPPPLGLDMDSSQPLTSSPLRERRKMCLVRQTSLSGYSEVQESPLKEHIAFTSQAGLHPPPPRPTSPALLSLHYCSPETSVRPPSPQSATQNMEDFKWQMGQNASYLHSLKPQMSSCSPPRLPHSHHLPQSGHMQPPLPPFVHPSQAHNYELSLQHLSQTPQRLPYQLIHNHMLQLQAQQLLLKLPLQPFPQPPGVFYHQQGSPPRPRESYKQNTQHGLRGLDTAVQAEVVTYPAVTFSLGEPLQDEAGSDRLPSSRMQRSSVEGAWPSNSLLAPPLHHSKSSHKLVVHTTFAGLLSTQGPGSQPRVLFGQRGAASLSEKHTKLMRTDSAIRSSVLYPLYDNNKVVAVCASRQGISSQLDNQAPSSKRMLSPASSLEIAVDMRRQHYQKRVKEGEEESELREVEEEASLVIDKKNQSQPLITSEGFTKSSSLFNSTDSSRSRKPTLVRQFCTMEPTDREGSPANFTDSCSVQSMSSPSRDAKGMAASEDSIDEELSKSPPLELGKHDNCPDRSAPEHEVGILKSAASNADIEMKDSLRSPTTIKVLVPIVTTDMAPSCATDSREEMAGGLGGPRRPPARAGVKVAVLHVVASGVSVPPSLILVADIAEVQQLLSPSLRTVVSTTWCFLNERARPARCAEHHPGGAPGPSTYGQWTPPAGASAGDPNPPGASTAEALALLQRVRGGHAGEGVYTLATIAPRGACSTVHSRLWMPCMALGAVPAAEPKATGAGRGRAAGPCRERGELEGRGAQDSAGPEPPPTKGGPQPSRIKIFEGGYKSNEEYVYVRGRGRGKYVCEECGIRCKKPSMLRKHIRSHSDLRPYRCHICSFAFKTKGNLTKHMKSKTHSKKCLEMGLTLVPVDDTDPEEAALENAHKKSSGDHQFSDADVSDGDREEEENEDDDDEDDEDDEVDVIAGLARRPGDHRAEDLTTGALFSAGDGWGPQGPPEKLYKTPGASFDAEVESLTSQFRAFPYTEGGKPAQQGSAGDKQHQHGAGFGKACWDSYSPHAMSINSESVAPSPGLLMNASLSPSQMSVSREGSPCTGEGERSSSPSASPGRAYSPGRVYSPGRAASDHRDDSTIDPFAAHYTEQLASNKLSQVRHQHHPPHHHYRIHHHFQQQQQASVSRLSVPFCERASRQQESVTQQQTQQSRDSLVPSRPRGHRAHSLSPYRRGSSGRPCSPSPSREAYSGAGGGGGSSSILRAQSLSPSRWSALRAADGPKDPDGSAGAARSPPCRSPPVDAAHHGVRDGLDCRPRPPWGDDAVTPSPASLPPADEEGSDPRASAMHCGTGAGSSESPAADHVMETCGGWAEARGVERGTAQPQDGYGRSVDPKAARAGLRTQPSLASASWHRQMFSHLPLHSQQPERTPTPKILVDGMRAGMGGPVYPLPPAPGAEEAMAALSTSARSNWAAVRDVEWRQQAFALLLDTQQLQQQQQQHQQPVGHSNLSGFASTMLPLSAIHSASRSSPGFSMSASPSSATSQMCGVQQQQQQQPQDGNVGLSKDHNS